MQRSVGGIVSVGSWMRRGGSVNGTSRPLVLAQGRLDRHQLATNATLRGGDRMVHLIFAAILLGQAQDPSRAIDAAFADLDRRYFAMLVSNGDALVAALGEGPSDVGSQTSRCLGLLTPLHGDLDITALRREMAIFATVVPDARPAVFELARRTAQTQAANIRLRLRVLEMSEEECLTSAIYRAQRMRTMEVSQDTQQLLSTITDRPTTSSKGSQ